MGSRSWGQLQLCSCPLSLAVSPHLWKLLDEPEEDDLLQRHHLPKEGHSHQMLSDTKQTSFICHFSVQNQSWHKMHLNNWMHVARANTDTHTRLSVCLPACMYVSLSVCLYVCTYVCMHAGRQAGRYSMYVCVYVCMCVYVYVICMCMCMCMYMYVYVCVCMCMYMYACRHVYACMHVCMSASCMYVCVIKRHRGQTRASCKQQQRYSNRHFRIRGLAWTAI